MSCKKTYQMTRYTTHKICLNMVQDNVKMYVNMWYEMSIIQNVCKNMVGNYKCAQCLLLPVAKLS